MRSTTLSAVAGTLLVLAAPFAGDDAGGAGRSRAESQAMEQAVRRYVAEVRNDGRMPAVDALFRDEVVSNGQRRDRAAFKRAIEAERASFDVRTTVEDLKVSGDTVVLRTTEVGTHAGTWMGLPATRRPVRAGAVEMFTFRGGKIAEHWRYVDRVATLVQIGAAPKLLDAPVQTSANASTGGHAHTR